LPFFVQVIVSGGGYGLYLEAGLPQYTTPNPLALLFIDERFFIIVTSA
jgi:hypothetical protein